MKVQILEHTPNPDRLVAQAAGLCYSGESLEELKKKLSLQEVDRRVNMLIRLGHESPLEHVNFTFGIEGISRACSHQLVRHRIASYSQQSQRYVQLDNFDYIIPPSIEVIPEAKERFVQAMEEDGKAYNELVELLLNKYAESYLLAYGINRLGEKDNFDFLVNMSKEESRDEKQRRKDRKFISNVEKRAIEDARYVFPNACATKIIVTMNVRSLFNFFSLRCCHRAQWEIQDLANEMLELCKQVSPLIFRTAGPSCLTTGCTEGPMSCGNPKKKILL